MALSRDPHELFCVWKNWRDVTGKKIRNLFNRYVELSNKAAVLNGFTDNAQMLLSWYEDPFIEEKVKKLWLEVKPLYLQLHAYVRRKIFMKYYNSNCTQNGYIPAHLLGNLWAQTWLNIYDIVVPYPNQPLPDLSEILKKHDCNPRQMFQKAEDFFVSLKLPKMTENFWKYSVIEQKNESIDIVCHASAWNMYDGDDFRIKMCTHITAEDFITIHHEMGHVQYYMHYKQLPIVFREGANPGFHEAIGDVIALSVSTPQHLTKIGFIEKRKLDETMKEKRTINYLLQMALCKIAFLPYAYIVSEWQFSVFRGLINNDNYNEYWWRMRKEYQGIIPPNKRSEEDFDPGAKYHIAAGVPYFRYFISFIIQFQIHESLCFKAGLAHLPLHECDIYRKPEAGNLLRRMLQLGYSKPWPVAMETLTGKKDMDAGPILKYFKPLHDWLIKENEKSGEVVGWKT